MKKERFLKGFLFCFVAAVAIGLIANTAIAQQIMMNQPGPVYVTTTGQVVGQAGPITMAGIELPKLIADIEADESDEDLDETIEKNDQVQALLAYAIDYALVDNFEYWTSPLNMGWTTHEPPYPVYGYGLGYGNVMTVVDFEEGSRVLDVYRPSSVFLFNTSYITYSISQCFAPCNGGPIDGRFSALNLKVRAPLQIEQFERFQVQVLAMLCNDEPVIFRIIPAENFQNGCSMIGAANAQAANVTIENFCARGTGVDRVIDIYVGRQFQDGTWHMICEDLGVALAAVRGDELCDPDDEDSGALSISMILGVQMIGNMYRADDIKFTRGCADNEAPYLFKIGPIYSQLWQPKPRLIYCEDLDLGTRMETVSYKDADGDTQSAVIFPGITDRSGHIYATDYDDILPVEKKSNGQYAIDLDGDAFDPDDLYYDDANSPADAAAINAFLAKVPRWICTVGNELGSNTQGVLMPVYETDPNGNLPYLLPQWRDTHAVTGQSSARAPIYNTGDDDYTNPMYTLAKWFEVHGLPYFPNVMAFVPGQGQVFEDMIFTIRVTDGVESDTETFPVSVVNYPVTNLPPLIEDVEDQIFYVNQPGFYQLIAIDPDGDTLTWSATLNGLPAYQVGPWINQIIHPLQGVVSIVPLFEGALTCHAICNDNRGMYAVAEFTIFCVNPGGWLNHPPVVTREIDSPKTIRAGQEFTTGELHIIDPDGEQLYYSCNIGSVGTNGVFSFSSNFPGVYMVMITAYDIRGGAVTVQFVLNVLPWWSM